VPWWTGVPGAGDCHVSGPPRNERSVLIAIGLAIVDRMERAAPA
jgi:hypothetical protein